MISEVGDLPRHSKTQNASMIVFAGRAKPLVPRSRTLPGQHLRSEDVQKLCAPALQMRVAKKTVR
jgi:hypothetical protein